jgi:hypothetical protein
MASGAGYLPPVTYYRNTRVTLGFCKTGRGTWRSEVERIRLVADTLDSRNGSPRQLLEKTDDPRLSGENNTPSTGRWFAHPCCACSRQKVALFARSWRRTSSSAFGGRAALPGSCGARVLLALLGPSNCPFGTAAFWGEADGAPPVRPGLAVNRICLFVIMRADDIAVAEGQTWTHEQRTEPPALCRRSVARAQQVHCCPQPRRPSRLFGKGWLRGLDATYTELRCDFRACHAVLPPKCSSGIANVLMSEHQAKANRAAPP